ncbi:hypothetical protein HHA02_11380 [Cobetia marina]|nr:hypothetical protein HHA02_11380 [Cobetia marina]
MTPGGWRQCSENFSQLGEAQDIESWSSGELKAVESRIPCSITADTDTKTDTVVNGGSGESFNAAW